MNHVSVFMNDALKANSLVWGTLQEIGFIDEAIVGLSHAERVRWLERYLTVCFKRADWDLIDGQKVINHIERELLTFKMLVLAGKS